MVVGVVVVVGMVVVVVGVVVVVSSVVVVVVGCGVVVTKIEKYRQHVGEKKEDLFSFSLCLNQLSNYACGSKSNSS